MEKIVPALGGNNRLVSAHEEKTLEVGNVFSKLYHLKIYAIIIS